MTVREAVDAYVAALKAEAAADGEFVTHRAAFEAACVAYEAARATRAEAHDQLERAVRARAKEATE